MLYIHKLTDFNQKSAEIESVQLLRDIKRRLSFPFSAEKLDRYFADFLVSPTDISLMREAQEQVMPVILAIQNLQNKSDEIYEAINLTRAVQLLQNLPAALTENILYSQTIYNWQGLLAAEAESILNSIPALKTEQEQQQANDKFNGLFKIMLRSEEFYFNADGIISEGHVHSIVSLCQSMSQGFFFHVTLEEELKKASFGKIRLRIPPDKLQEAERIGQLITQIRRGTERGYDVNMRMVNCAVVLYSLIKSVPHFFL